MPWSIRDVWLGVVGAAVIVAVSFGVAYLISVSSIRVDPDLWVGLVPTLFTLLFLVPVWWLSMRKYGAPARSLGFVGFRPSVLAVGIALLIAVYNINGLYVLLLDHLGVDMHNEITPVLGRVSSPWPLIVSAVVVAPVVEETFFRGFVFAGLRARYDWRWAAVITSAVFAAAHLDIAFFIPLFLLGFLFAFLYQRSGSVWPGTIVHAIVNALALTVAYFVF